MTNNDIKKTLKSSFGLSDKEVEVYLSLLKIGQTETRKLSTITGLYRTSLYDTLNVLEGKGLICSNKEKNINKYTALSPKSLLKLIDSRKLELEQIIPEIDKINKTRSDTKLSIFYGKEGVNLLDQDVIDNATDIIYTYGSSEFANEIIKYSAMDFVKKRMSKKIKMKSITDSLIKDHPRINDSKYRKITNIKINDEFRKMRTWNYIYANKVAIISYQDNDFVSIIINDKQIHDSQEKLFLALWNKIKEQLI